MLVIVHEREEEEKRRKGMTVSFRTHQTFGISLFLTPQRVAKGTFGKVEFVIRLPNYTEKYFCMPILESHLFQKNLDLATS